jgi:hypothetical protein
MKQVRMQLVCMFFFSTLANSQITKGNWLVGGTGNFTSYENNFTNNGVENSNKGFGIRLAPDIGYFLANRFAAGSLVILGSEMPKDANNTLSYGIGPFARYYFLDEDKLINILVQANFVYGESFSKVNNAKSYTYGFKAGPAIFFNSSVALEVTLEYNAGKLIPDGLESSSYNNLQIGLGFQIHLIK